MNCSPVLPQVAVPVYWISSLIFTSAIVALIICIAYTKINVQAIVALHSLFNLWVMLISTLMVLSVHHDYSNQYPFHRELKSDGVICTIHSALSIVSLLIPSTSLVLLTAIHYRAVFWSRFENKLENKHIVGFVLLTWFTVTVIMSLWAAFHNNYSAWYCLPFMASNSFSWATVILQFATTISSVTFFIVFVICYVKMILQVHKEEALVKSARSRKISTTRQLSVKFGITCVLHASQLILMVTVMVVALLESDDVIQAVSFAAYLLAVACTDVYLHAYVILKKLLF